MKKLKRNSRTHYFFGFLFLLIIEILIAEFAHDPFIRPYLGRFPGGHSDLLFLNEYFQNFCCKRLALRFNIFLWRRIFPTHQHCKAASVPASKTGNDHAGQQFFCKRFVLLFLRHSYLRNNRRNKNKF